VLADLGDHLEAAAVGSRKEWPRFLMRPQADDIEFN
jgi:hypothetical protein